MPAYGSGKVKWTPELEEAIRKHYPTMGAVKLAEMLGIDSDSVMNRAFALGVKFHKDFHWTEESLQAIQERYATDGPAKLAKELGTTPFAVTAKARRLGIGSTRKRPPKDFEWTEEMLTAIRERYVKEGGAPLAKEFGTTVDTVRRKASSMSLHTIAGHAVAGRERAENSTSCDIHYFDKLRPNSAWLLGFIYADGCIPTPRGGRPPNTLSFTLSRKDEHILEFVKKEFKSKLPIFRTEKTRAILKGREIRSESSHLQIHSNVLIKRLIELGVNPRKTYRDDPFPTMISDEMMPHFIRGYFDGDGSASLYKYRGVDACMISFVGNKKHLTGIRGCLVRLADMKQAPVAEKKQYNIDHLVTITWYAVEDLERFHKFIYPPGEYFYLKRKKDILDKWLAMPHRGSRRLIKWSPNEEALLMEKYEQLGPTKMGNLLNRDRITVYTKAIQLGLVPHKKYIKPIRKET